jgi:hypothetical protein
MKLQWDAMVMVQLETTTCAGCGMPFAFPAELIATLRKTGDTFYCPIGHTLSFTNSLQDKLKAEEKKRKEAEARAKEANRLLEVTTNRAEFYEGIYHQELEEKKEVKKTLATTRRQLTNTKKRIAHGTCPCCRRTFQNLQRHMAHQHPGYAEGEQDENA